MNLTAEEILKAKAKLKFSIVKSLEFSSSNANRWADHLLFYDRFIEIEEKVEKINNVSKESIKRVVRKMLQSKPTIASIGPIKKLEKLENIQSRFV